MFDFLFGNSGKSIKVDELYDSIGKISLIDVREPYEYKNGHLPTAKNIPMGKIIAEADRQLDKSKEYYIICQSGSRSSRTCNTLRNMGYNVINVAGGTGMYKGELEK